MPLDEQTTDQNDPHLDQRADLQRALKQTLHYIMELASVAELFGLQGYLSALASRMTDVGPRLPSEEQIRERQRQSMLQGLGPNYTPGQNHLRDTALRHDYQNQLRGET